MRFGILLGLISILMAGCGGDGATRDERTPPPSSPPGLPVPTATVSPAVGAEVLPASAIRITFSTRMDPSTLSTEGHLESQVGSAWGQTNVPDDTLIVTLADTWTGVASWTLNVKDTQGTALAPLFVGHIVKAQQTLAIGNVRHKGAVHSGFLAGTAATANIATVEVSLDGGQFQPAVGTAAWKFKLPSGADTWKDHTQHTITVRGLDGSGVQVAQSGPITVRKGNNRDINGDGYADLVTTRPDNNVFVLGRVLVFHSMGSGGVTATTPAAAHTTIVAETELTGFGNALALGDVNGDGYADLVVGAPGVSSIQGPGSAMPVYVFHSTGTAGIVAGVASDADTKISAGASTLKGSALAVGDVNGDGFADVAATGSDFSAATGFVYMFHSAGPAGVLTGTGDAADSQITGGDPGETLNSFGFSLAMGDVNGDGFADVVAGVHHGNIGNSFPLGRVHVFHSDGAAGVTIANAADAHARIIAEDANHHFGFSLATGDVNGDGFVDVVVGSPEYLFDPGFLPAGRVFVFRSTGAAGVTATDQFTADTTITSGGAIWEVRSKFGNSLAVGDVNGDGFADVVAGAQNLDSGRGRVYVFHSAAATGVASVHTSGAQGKITGHTVGSLGMAIATGDMNGDGFADVVATAPFFKAIPATDPVRGRVYVFHSAGSAGVNLNNPDVGIVVPTVAGAHTVITGDAGDRLGLTAVAQ